MTKTISREMLAVIRTAVDALSDDARQLVRSFAQSQMMDGALFKDRSGGADLYYTLFGVLVCDALGVKINRQRLRKFIKNQKFHSLDFVHQAALLRLRIFANLLRLLVTPQMPSPAGAFPHGDPNTPYSQFLKFSLMQDLKIKPPHCSLIQYRTEQGGYSNIPGALATTNATTAALALLGAANDYQPNDDVHYLRSLQQSSGGFTAAIDSPIPDLLSTATSLFVLYCYGIEPQYDATDFVTAHWSDSGGFVATLLDTQSDMEYTFYGLLALGVCTKYTKN